MSVTAKEILGALRIHWKSDPVIREVVLGDPQQEAIYRRYQLEAFPRSADHYLREWGKKGLPVAESVPDGWRPGNFDRRIDALVWENPTLTAVEIKVTRADFRNDTEEKRRAWRDHTNRFVFAVPAGLVTLDEVPEGCGLMEYHPELRTTRSSGLKLVKKATINHAPSPLPPRLVRAMFYRVSNYEKVSEMKAAA